MAIPVCRIINHIFTNIIRVTQRPIQKTYRDLFPRPKFAPLYGIGPCGRSPTIHHSPPLSPAATGLTGPPTGRSLVDPIFCLRLSRPLTLGGLTSSLPTCGVFQDVSDGCWRPGLIRGSYCKYSHCVFKRGVCDWPKSGRGLVGPVPNRDWHW